MMLTLFYSPNACSMASHVALEEAGATFEARPVDIFNDEQFTAAYRAINPRSRVPALRFDDGRVLLETTAILGWIGAAFPEADLLGGGDAIDRARTVATCAWLSGPVHPTFRRIVRAEQFTADESGREAVRAKARTSYWDQLREIDGILADRPWMMGERFTVADAYALVFFAWGRELDLPVADLTSVVAMKVRFVERPAVRRALEREGNALLRP